MSETKTKPIVGVPCSVFLEALVITVEDSLRRARGAYNALAKKMEGSANQTFPSQAHVEKGKILALTPISMVLKEYVAKLSPDKETEVSNG